MNEQQCISIINGLLTQGDLAMQRGNIDAAKNAFQRAKDMSREISSGQNTGFAIACDKLGDVARWSGEYSTARDQYHQALPIFRDLASTNTAQRRDVSLCLSKIGELNMAEGNLSEAQSALDEHFKTALEIASSDPSHCEHQRDLAGAHGRLQQLAMASSDLPEAVKHAEAAHAILQKLVGIDSSNIGWVQDLAGSNCMFASLLLQTGDMLRAISMLTRGFGMLKELDHRGKLDRRGKQLLKQLDAQFPSPLAGSEDVTRVLNQTGSAARVAVKQTASTGGRAEIQAHDAQILAIAVSRAGDCFVTGGADGCMKIWTTSQHTPLRIISAHQQAVTGLAITHDASRVFSCSWDRALKAWHIHDGSLVAEATHLSADLSSITCTADGSVVYAVGENGAVNEWCPGKDLALRIAAFHPGAMMIASADDGVRLVSGSSDGQIALWNPKSTKLQGMMQGHSDGVQAVAITRNGTTAVSGSKDKTAIVWDLEKLQSLRNFTGHGDVVSALVLSDDARVLASGAWDNTVRIWRLADGKQLALFEFASQVWSIAATGDFGVLVVGEQSGMVTVLKLDPLTFAPPC